MTLAQTNTYFVGSPSQATVTVQDSDAAANIVAVASLNAPVGIDYHPTTDSLIVSVNLSQQSVGGEPVNFARVDSSGTSNAWTTPHGMGFADDEIKLAIVKVSTNLGLGAPEDLRLIPSGQNLYCLDFTSNQMLKVPAVNFAAFVGDILVVDEGRGCAPAGLYIVHWDGGRFVVRQIPLGTELENVTFAPIDIPAL